ncbi:hypothetical protein KDH_12700 [Dictyobacter sp. S3.2.2.5]|uniref:Uncharacterized protein n=1 Tax=Dictyobacter halimunensis TaxID=3026934 RepID=A0ABQ6FNN2_9CHLR|nr:hypothetical protein KDH_12700 [Dictyobacter sp. S3.2.2.5]
MLSKEAFDQWCWQLGLSDQTKEVITRIRTSNPSRCVQGSAGNVSETYPPSKWGSQSSLRATRMNSPLPC